NRYAWASEDVVEARQAITTEEHKSMRQGCDPHVRIKWSILFLGNEMPGRQKILWKRGKTSQWEAQDRVASM
ncbi:hypothetical protein J6590_062023, partial [Homalodisca vitripennis]